MDTTDVYVVLQNISVGCTAQYYIRMCIRVALSWRLIAMWWYEQEMNFCQAIRRSIGTNCNWIFWPQRPSSTVELVMSSSVHYVIKTKHNTNLKPCAFILKLHWAYWLCEFLDWNGPCIKSIGEIAHHLHRFAAVQWPEPQCTHSSISFCSISFHCYLDLSWFKFNCPFVECAVLYSGKLLRKKIL